MLTPQPGSSIEYKITPEEMWTTVRGQTQNWGIEGYEVPRKYFDHEQYKWEIKRSEILNRHKREWPPSDWPKDKETEKPIPPVRKNYIDDVIKLAKSFNDPVKSEEVKANLESRGTFKVPEPKKPINMRDKFLKEEAEKKEKFASLPKIQEWKANAIEDAQKKIEEMKSKERPKIEIYKERYTKEKPQWPRCDRVTIVADSEYVGEQIPFYNTYAKKGEEPDKKKLFYPKKEFTWKKAPVWSFDNKSPTKLPTENMQTRDALYKEKIDNMKSAKNIQDKDLLIDIDRSYKLMNKRGKYPLTFHKPFDYAGTEQYKSNKEQHPDYSPGPQHYWKSKEFDTNSIPKEMSEEKEVNGKNIKIYYMNRKRTDYRIYKPTRGSVF